MVLISLHWKKEKCISCDEVKSECHVILKCHLYKNIRDSFYEGLKNALSCDEYYIFLKGSDIEKLCYTLSNPQCVKLAARTCADILERRKLLTYS